METKNETRGMMTTDYGDEKADKSVELNETMTIKETPQDEYTRKIKNIGGNE
ncbi:MAG: hypothetical protein GX790_10380 [Syntrophomonadaceae bacterium]|nr:hypothetical protein [Syntrophomonadaceae bacterium]